MAARNSSPNSSGAAGRLARHDMREIDRFVEHQATVTNARDQGERHGSQSNTLLAIRIERMVRSLARKKRNLFGELMEGVSAMQTHRSGRITVRSHHVERLALPRIDQKIIRSTRERLRMSRPAFAYRIGVNPRTLERWEQGRSQPNDQAAALILLVRKYPDMLKPLQQLAVAG